MDEQDFLVVLTAYTEIQRLIGVIEGASLGIENVNVSNAIGSAALGIANELDKVFPIIRVIDEDEDGGGE